MRRFLVIGGVLLLAGSAGLYHWAQSPATSRQSDLSARNSSAVLGDRTVLKPWQTAYFKTQVPDVFEQKTTIEAGGRPIVGSYLLNGTGDGASDQIAVIIGTLNNVSLAETSAVKLRNQLPMEYLPVSYASLPSGSYAFARADHTNTTIIWQHDKQYVTLSVSTTASRVAEQREIINGMLANWQWDGSQIGVLQ